MTHKWRLEGTNRLAVSSSLRHYHDVHTIDDDLGLALNLNTPGIVNGNTLPYAYIVYMAFNVVVPNKSAVPGPERHQTDWSNHLLIF